MSNISPSDVTIKVKNTIDDRVEGSKAFRAVTAVIQVRGEKAGSIDAVIVDRKRIPENTIDTFDRAMDEHSSELQFIAVSLFEPKLGRTRVKSLKDGGDDEKRPFMYVELMHVDDEYKEGGQKSDVATYALHMFLHDPNVQRRKISSCIYILDPDEAMTRQENEKNRMIRLEQCHEDIRRQFEPVIETEESIRAEEKEDQKMEQYARIDAIPYLRNGFYQDEAVARMSGNAARILLATPSQWSEPLKTQNEVAAIQLYVAKRIPTLMGRDAEIMELTKSMCEECSGRSATPGNTLFQMLKKERNEARASAYLAAVTLQIQQGGSLVRSHALHAACANNDTSIVKCILELDSSTLSARDMNNDTPLMVAAFTAAGGCNKDGFPLYQPLLDILLSAGADKDATNSEGLTAYGVFLQRHNDLDRMMQALCMRQPSDSRLIPGYAQLEAKLRPRNGPTRADLTGGDSEKPGLIHYAEEDERKTKRLKR